MNSSLKRAVGAPALVVVAMAAVACGPVAVATSSAVASAVAPPSAVASSVAVSPSAAVTSSRAPTPSQHVATMTVAGTEVTSSPLRLTVELPPDWQADGSVADIGTSSPPSGMAFVVSLVDNTFQDPCTHTQRSPKVGATIEDLAAALGKIPGTTATAPVKTKVAGYDATYVEIAIPASLPCQPSEFYLWQDSPDGDWWVQGLNETARIWILQVRSQRVTFLTHSYPGSGPDAKAEFQKILDSIVFDGG
jgi:hypothetical protein